MILNQIHWNPDPEIINILGISIRYYSLLFLSGIVLCFYILGYIFKNEKIPTKYHDQLLIYGTLGILVGARLGHCLFYQPDYYLSHPLEMLLPIKFVNGGGIEFTGYRGLASHGGVLGLIIAMFIYSRRTKQPIIKVVDMIAIVSGLGAGFIRLANLMNSEIIGIPTTKPWAFIFEKADNIPRHPAQLYEAISYYTIFIILIILYKRNNRLLGNGFFFGLLLTLIFTTRFFIEFIKENQVRFEDDFYINMGQILSVPYILLGVGFIIYSIRKSRI